MVTRARNNKYRASGKVRCEWDQHGSQLNISLVSSGAVKLKDVNVILSNRDCSVGFPGGLVWSCTFYGEIEASCSKVQCRERKRQLILILQKKHGHADWPGLAAENDAGDAKSSGDRTPDDSAVLQPRPDRPDRPDRLLMADATTRREPPRAEKTLKPSGSADVVTVRLPGATERDKLPANEQSTAAEASAEQTAGPDVNKTCDAGSDPPAPARDEENQRGAENADREDPLDGCVRALNINNNWYKKTPDIMVANVYLKQMHRDTCLVTSPHHLTLVFQSCDEKFLKQHKNATAESRFQWTLPFLHAIDPENSSYTLQTSYLEIWLRKKDGQAWKSTDQLCYRTHEERPAQDASRDLVGSPPQLARGATSCHVPSDLPENGALQWSEPLAACTCQAKPMCKVPPMMASGGSDSDEAELVCLPGFTGLVNLGNTCYMNCVIQALSNTRELRDYLHDPAFKNDINYSNVLGTGGRLAVNFAIVLQALWMGTHYAFSPSKLKDIVSNKAIQFSGFSQHDAQEFLTFLLDGLHEDLNLAANNASSQQHHEPYDGPSDRVPGLRGTPVGQARRGLGSATRHMAVRAWMRHKAWNDSFIVNLFHGLYKSKLVCPACRNVSITFDPFVYLPVPLPQKLSVYFLPREPYRRPVKLSVSVRHRTEVIKSVAARMKVHPNNLKLVKVSNARIVEANGTLEQAASSDMHFCCEVLSCELAGERVRVLPVMQRRKIPDTPVTSCANCQKTDPVDCRLRRCMNCNRVGYCNLNCQRSHWVAHKGQCQPEAIGLPFLVSIPESRLTFRRLAQIMVAYARYSVNVFQPPAQPGASFLQDPPSHSPSPTPFEISAPLPPPSPPPCSRQSLGDRPSLKERPSRDPPTASDEGGRGPPRAGRPVATAAQQRRGCGQKNGARAEAPAGTPPFEPGWPAAGVHCPAPSPGDKRDRGLRQLDAPHADEPETPRGEDGVDLKRGLGGRQASDRSRTEDREAAVVAAATLGARVESPAARTRAKDGTEIKRLEAAVHGLQQQDESLKGWKPQFSIKVIYNNVERTLDDRGDGLLNIPDGAQLAMDWNNNSKQHGHVMVLPRELDCDEDIPAEEHRSGWDPKDSTPVSLHHCLTLFTKSETLTPEEAWLCPHCDEPRQALKQLMLWRLPRVLIVQLKRFSFSSNVLREKISDLVTFPIRGLDMSEFCPGAASGGTLGGACHAGPVYDLYAVINHYGGLIGGHYTVVARLPSACNSQRSDIGWRRFNDSTVTEVNENQVMTQHAYLLFYRRRNCPRQRYCRRPAEVPRAPVPARQDPAREVIVLVDDEDDDEQDDDDLPFV